jgi:hypothetical protein
VALLELLPAATTTRIVAPDLRLAAAIRSRDLVMIVPLVVTMVAVRTVDVMLLLDGLSLCHCRLPDSFERRDPTGAAAGRIHQLGSKWRVV